MTHSNSLREEAHTRVACTLYFRTNKFEVCLGFFSKGLRRSAVPADAESRKVYRIRVNRSGKKFHTPRTYLRPIFRTDSCAFPPQPLLHLVLSPHSLCSNLFFCKYCIHKNFWNPLVPVSYFTTLVDCEESDKMMVFLSTVCSL
jgi:hypothetical protein